MTSSENGAPEWLVDLVVADGGAALAVLWGAILLTGAVVVLLVYRVEWSAALVEEMVSWGGPPVTIAATTWFIKTAVLPPYWLTVAAGFTTGAVIWLAAKGRVVGAAVEAYEGQGQGAE